MDTPAKIVELKQRIRRADALVTVLIFSGLVSPQLHGANH